MAQKVYALLVGINDYAPGIRKLSGCLNDVDHFHAYLANTFDKANLAIEVLKDSDATRDNISRQFRTHLGRATADDVAVFQYCGHGARWASANEFKQFYPDGMDEGLVCYDSRREHGAYPYDLADKELAVLLAEVARKKPHLAVILDCCHSGSGTRDVDAFTHLEARQTHGVLTERPLDSYIDGHYSQLRAAGAPLSIPRSAHVLLAACDRTEKALERADRSGVFTSTLLASLDATGPDVTYADLFVRCRMQIRKEVQNQTPQFEAYENFNAWSGFLGRRASRADGRFKVHFDQGSWTIDTGAIHGVSTEKGVSLALYPDADHASSTGTATTIAVGLEKSTVQLDFEGDRAATYQGEITSFAVPPMPIHFAGDAATKDFLHAALARSVNVTLTDVEEAAAYSLSVANGQWLLKQRELDLLVQGVKVDDQSRDQAADFMARILRKVVRWEQTLALQNRRTRMDPALVEFVYAERQDDGREHVYEAEDIPLDYVKRGTEWKEIRGRFKVRNRTAQPVHLVLAYFTAAYGIHTFYNDRIPPGDDYATIWGDNDNHYFWLDDDTKNESIEEFKLFVSTEHIDGFSLPQDPLTLGRIVSPSSDRAAGQVTPKKVAHENEWFTKHLRLKVVRQIDQVGATKDTAVAQGQIVVKAHPSVTANVSMSAAKVLARSVGDGSDFYKALERSDWGGLELLNFSGTRGGGDNQNVLELTGVQNAESLKDNPLHIEVRVPLNDDEGILPVVFDGEHVLLGGDAYKDDDGHTQISIDQIPDIPDHRRSLGGSLKLYFFKTYLKMSNVNLLRWVSFEPDGSCAYHDSGLADRVIGAQNILLLVHGIIGDTAGMAQGVRASGLDARFDLVLTYDYENLGTKIEETARTLKSQLAAAGLHAQDGKKLTLLAHSMGGLVSRWFIEREGGNTVVDHLVMCGTPNNGSPFGKIDGARKILSMLTGLAVNYAPMFVQFSGPILFALNRSKKVTPTLEQMNPTSEFITTLNASEDPGIRYTILAGDVEAYTASADGLFGKLLAKTGQGVVFDALFSMHANDIAVSVESILGVEGTRAISPVRKNVPCHHLNYFASDVGQAAITAVEW